MFTNMRHIDINCIYEGRVKDIKGCGGSYFAYILMEWHEFSQYIYMSKISFYLYLQNVGVFCNRILQHSLNFKCNLSICKRAQTHRLEKCRLTIRGNEEQETVFAEEVGVKPAIEIHPLLRRVKLWMKYFSNAGPWIGPYQDDITVYDVT